MSVESVPPRVGAVRFLLDADTAPGLLPRLLQPFAKRDLTPERMWSHRRGETLHVEITLADPDPAVVALIAGNLRQVVGVHAVHQVSEQPQLSEQAMRAA